MAKPKWLFLAALIACTALYAQSSTPPSEFGGIHLLKGYSAQRVWTVDAQAWEIKGSHHFVIHYEAEAGSWADPKDIQQYAWYRKTTIHGYTVRFALIKPGLKTQWEPERGRDLPPGNILLVTYVFWRRTKQYPEYSANFSAKIAGPSELADALLMTLTFDPSRESVSALAGVHGVSAVGGESGAFRAVNLLPGYTAVREQGIDVAAWKIEKPGGLIIHFEAGMSEGLAVNQRERNKYEWYREQLINGHRVLAALTRPGAKYSPDLDRERNLPPGNILLISYPLGGHKDHAANFIAKVASPEETGDALLMALTFDPSKSAF
jgi:hypothetical protein